MSKPILVDVDGVLADIVGLICAELTIRGYPRTEKDITTYEFDKCLTLPEVAILNDIMAQPGFVSRMADCDCLDGLHAVRSLQIGGSDVVIVTKPHVKSPTWAYERTRWLSDRGFTRVIHTGHKELIPGSCLVEDSLDNASRWASAHPDGFVVLIDRPWNQAGSLSAKRIYRASKWSHALRVIHGDLRDQAA